MESSPYARFSLILIIAVAAMIFGSYGYYLGQIQMAIATSAQSVPQNLAPITTLSPSPSPSPEL